MRWEKPVVRMGKKRNSYRFLVGKHEGKRPSGTLGPYRRMSLKWTVKK
jgi:hypothetical protein